MAELPPAATPFDPRYATAQTATQLAGFWTRFLAYLIDAVILGVASSIVLAVIGVIVAASDSTAAVLRGGLIGLILGELYFGYLWSRDGQSIGYKVVGIRVVRVGGGPVSFGLAALRYLAIHLSLIVCWVPAIISAFMIGLGERKQGIHDLMVGTQVVRA